MKSIRKFLALLICMGILIPSAAVSAHNGEGHHNGSTSNSTKRYYCNGHSAHAHKNGVCPYSPNHVHDDGVCPNPDNCPYATASGTSTQASSSGTYSRTQVKQIQKKLNRLGYACGKADGILDTKTKKAIRKYQNAHHMSVNGKINKTLCRKLNIR